MEKYSKIYKFEDKSFRYNNEEALLEWISLTDYKWTEDNTLARDENDDVIIIELDEPMVVDCIGLDRDNWKDSPEYWCEKYHYELEEELRFM